VRIHYSDGRLFLRKTQSLYDIIFIGLSAPHELQSNRFFTSEFFSMAKHKLSPSGIIVLTLPGSLTYLSSELRNLNRCILETLRGVFRHVRIIPGDVNLYLSSDSDPLGEITLQEILKRHEERKIRTGLFTKGYIEDRLQERWSRWLSTSLEAGAVHRNSDFHPLGVFYHLSYWNTLFSSSLATIFKRFEGLSLTWILIFMVLLTSCAAILFCRNSFFSRQALPYSIFTTGVTGMVLELAIIFTFQTLYGYLYHQIGLLVTLFMGGVACSSLTMTHRLERIGKGTVLFLGTELALILFSIFLPFAFTMLSHFMEKGTLDAIVYGVFLALSFLSGLLIGIQFPLGAKIYLNLPAKREGLGHTAGLLYAVDLLGGFFGGLLGGILLLPILGLRETCLLLGMIKLSSFLLFLLFAKMHQE
jgi:spermidine synthase